MQRRLLGAAYRLSGCVDPDIAPLFLTAEDATAAAPLASEARNATYSSR